MEENGSTSEDERKELQEIPAAELTADRDKDCDRSETPARFLLASYLLKVYLFTANFEIRKFKIYFNFE